MQRFTIPASALPFGITLEQDGVNSFTVTYGLQRKSGLSYSGAADELGACIMHALSCEGAIDNRTKSEARRDGDYRPYFSGGAIMLQGA